MSKKYFFECSCGRIQIKTLSYKTINNHTHSYVSPPICICGSDEYRMISENKYREIKLKRILNI